LSGVNATGNSQTLLVLDKVDLQTVASEDIKQIDQDDSGESFSTVTVGALKDGTYEVRIGGDGTIQTATFTVGSTDNGDNNNGDNNGGDTDNGDNNNGDNNGGDTDNGDNNNGGGNGGETPTTHTVLVGDADQSGRVTSADASFILTAVTNKTTASITGDAQIAAARCTGDDRITAGDASAILTYYANKTHEYVNKKIEVAD
jgi:hypothetical protein